MITRAVIPAAGRGTRLLPATKEVPKEMLPVAGKPMIQLCVEEAVAAGISHVCIVLNPRRPMVRDYFCSWPRGCSASNRVLKRLHSLLDKCGLEFAWQAEPRGVADAIACAKDFTDGEPFALMLPDNVVFCRRPVIAQIEETFVRYGKDTNAVARIAGPLVQTFSQSGRIDYEVAGGRALRIKRLYRKRRDYYPSMETTLVRTIARAILLPRFFRYIDAVRKRVKGELEDGQVLREIVRCEGLMGHMIEGTVFDAGNPRGYAAANSWAISHS